MSDKPGFLDGLLAGWDVEGESEEPDTPNVAAVKDFVEGIEPSTEEMAQLGAWFLTRGFSLVLKSLFDDE